MGTFTTLLSVQACLLPVSYIRFLQAQYPNDPPFAATDPVDDVEVEVEYNEGWYQAGNRSGHPDSWEPDDGEDPEITSVCVVMSEGDWLIGEGEDDDLQPSLTDAQERGLVAEAEEDQRQAADSYY